MTRRYVLGTALAATLAAGAAFVNPAPRLVWNATASAPIGLYLVSPGRRPAIGDLVLSVPDRSVGGWLARRHYVPLGVPLIKPLAAIEGQEVCRSGASVTIDGRTVAVARTHDRAGRMLPVWAGCWTLGRDELMLLNRAVGDSLDGRYFGPTPAHAVIGTLRPLLTRPRPGAALVWQGWRP